MSTRQGIAAVGIVLALAATAACSDDDQPVARPTGTPLPTSSSTPAVSASPASTGFPQTSAGAGDFARFYIGIGNQAALTGDVDTLIALSLPDCSGCRDKAESITRAYEGGHLEGGEVVVHSVTAPPLNGESVTVTAAAEQRPGRLVRDTTVTITQNIPAVENLEFSIDLTWVDRGWKVAEIIATPL